MKNHKIRICTYAFIHVWNGSVNFGSLIWFKACKMNSTPFSRLFELHRGEIQGSIINPGKSIHSITMHPVLNTFCSQTFSVCLSFLQTQTPVHLKLLVQHVHGSGLRQQRSSAAVLLQAGQGHPVERRVRRAWSGADKSG